MPACPPVAAVVPLLPVLAPDVVWAPFDEVVELSEEEVVWAPFWLVDAASGLVVLVMLDDELVCAPSVEVVSELAALDCWAPLELVVSELAPLVLPPPASPVELGPSPVVRCESVALLKAVECENERASKSLDECRSMYVCVWLIS